MITRNNTCGLILAAGDQLRFDSDVPKALMKIPNSDETLLDKNIKTLKRNTNVIYVAVNTENQEKFDEIIKKYDNVKLLVISSGHGCGDAVINCLDLIYSIDEHNTHMILIWGDSLYQSKLSRKINDTVYNNTKYENCDILVPVVHEVFPYVTINTDESNLKISSVYFSKYLGQLNSGYHDLSTFIFNIDTIYIHLIKLNDMLYDDNTKQYSKSIMGVIPKKELVFLDIFNVFYNELDGHIMDCTLDYIKAKSFNTVKEYDNIIKGVEF